MILIEINLKYYFKKVEYLFEFSKKLIRVISKFNYIGEEKFDGIRRY